MGIIGDVVKAKVVGSEVRKGIKELRAKDEEKKEEIQKIKCPKCKGAYLERQIRFVVEGGFLKGKYYKIVTFYCPLCSFKKENKLLSSFEEHQAYNRALAQGKTYKN